METTTLTCIRCPDQGSRYSEFVRPVDLLLEGIRIIIGDPLASITICQVPDSRFFILDGLQTGILHKQSYYFVVYKNSSCLRARTWIG